MNEIRYKEIEMISFYSNHWQGPTAFRTAATEPKKRLHSTVNQKGEQAGEHAAEWDRNYIDYVFQPMDFSMKYGLLSNMVEFQR